MKMKKTLCMMFACIALIGSFIPNAGAASVEPCTSETIARGSGKFNTNLPANDYFTADIEFFLEADETVTIRASYSPKSASVDFGLIAPDGLFYSSNTENGSISVTLSIGQRGYYTLAVRNNSNNDVYVTGFVNY